MTRLALSIDKNANLKRLKRLEARGLVELFAVAIEGLEDTSRIRNMELPIAVIGSKFFRFDRAVIAANDNKYRAIQKILGKQNHGDCLHLERHINSGREVFVTDDNDFLCCRDALKDAFGISILTVDELEARLGLGINGD